MHLDHMMYVFYSLSISHKNYSKSIERVIATILIISLNPVFEQKYPYLQKDILLISTAIKF